MTPSTLRNGEPQSAHSASVCWSSCSSLSVPNPRLKVIPGIETSGQGSEVFEARGGDHAEVLHAHAAEAHQVQAGLHCDDVALLERLAVGAHHPGRFVHVQADAMAGAVVHPGDAF